MIREGFHDRSMFVVISGDNGDSWVDSLTLYIEYKKAEKRNKISSHGCPIKGFWTKEDADILAKSFAAFHNGTFYEEGLARSGTVTGRFSGRFSEAIKSNMANIPRRDKSDFYKMLKKALIDDF